MNRGNDPHAVIAPRFPLWIANQGLELEVVATRRGRSSPRQAPDVRAVCRGRLSNVVSPLGVMDRSA